MNPRNMSTMRAILIIKQARKVEMTKEEARQHALRLKGLVASKDYEIMMAFYYGSLALSVMQELRRATRTSKRSKPTGEPPQGNKKEEI
jgi:hypothetical protein